MKIGHAFETIEESNTETPSEPYVTVRHLPTGTNIRPTGADRLKWHGRRLGSGFVLAVAGEAIERWKLENLDLAVADANAAESAEQIAPAPEAPSPLVAGVTDDADEPGLYVTDVQWHWEADGMVRVTMIETVRGKRSVRGAFVMRVPFALNFAQMLGADMTRAMTPQPVPKEGESPQGTGRLVH